MIKLIYCSVETYHIKICTIWIIVYFHHALLLLLVSVTLMNRKHSKVIAWHEVFLFTAESASVCACACAHVCVYLNDWVRESERILIWHNAKYFLMSSRWSYSPLTQPEDASATTLQSVPAVWGETVCYLSEWVKMSLQTNHTNYLMTQQIFYSINFI